MKKSLYALFFLSMSFATAIFAVVADSNIHIPLDYYTSQPPGVGGSYTDPNFGVSVKRISDALGTSDVAAGGYLTWVVNEYSTMSPFNLDNSRLLLTHDSYFALYDGSGSFLSNLPLEVHAGSEPRWSRSDANVFYYIRGNQLKSYNISSSAMSVVHTFSEFSSITGKGESDICFDGNHFVFAGNDRYIFVYEISTDTKGPVFDPGGSNFNQLYITPNDNVLVGYYATGSNRFQGIELYDRSMRFLRQVTTTIGHMDVTRDTNGDEVLIWTNANDSQPVCDNAIVKVRLSDGRQTCLLTLDWSLAVHISAPDNNGWAFVETYAPVDPDPSSNAWKPYTNELLKVKLDGSQVVRLAHHRSRPLNSYQYQPKASVSRDGSRLVFSSNFGLQSILNYPTEYSDVYLLSDGSSTPGGSGGSGGSSSPELNAVGLYNPNTSIFYLKNSKTSGTADLTFQYGSAGAGWTPLIGDWNGDGIETVGLYNPATSVFYLRNSNTAGIANLTFQYGPGGAGWIPLAGDWNGDGIDTVGLYNPATGVFYLRNSNTTGMANLTFQYGPGGAGWLPVVGDWNGDGIETVGLWNPASSIFYLRNSNTAGVANLTFQYGPGGAGMLPLVRDWNGDGTDTVGLYNPSTSIFYLRNSNTTGTADQTFQYGPGGAGWTPRVGAWN